MVLVAIALFLILYLAVIEFLTISLKLTGLSYDISKFQSISIFSTIGFTTKESELITQHPLRRKLCSQMMVITHIANLTIMSSLFYYLNKGVGLEDLRVVIVASLICLLYRRLKLHAYLDIFLEKILLRRMMSNKNKTMFSREMVKKMGDYMLYLVMLDRDSNFIGKSIRNSKLKMKGIQVLNIDKGNSFIGFPKPEYVFEAEDRLLIYGDISTIEEVFLEGCSCGGGEEKSTTDAKQTKC